MKIGSQALVSSQALTFCMHVVGHTSLSKCCFKIPWTHEQLRAYTRSWYVRPVTNNRVLRINEALGLAMKASCLINMQCGFERMHAG